MVSKDFTMTLEELLCSRGIKIIEEVGKGATKRVCLGEISKNKKVEKVAVKIINPEFLITEKIRRAFLAEAEILQQLDHPNIENLKDAFMTDEFVVLITEFLEGISLLDFLDELSVNEGKQLPWHEVFYLIREIANGLKAIHHRGFVHRDISPANIILMNDGGGKLRGVKLIDLGLAKNMKTQGSQSLSGIFQVKGTYFFAAPELLENASMVDERSDSFSLATLMYYCLTLEFPFGSEEGYYERVKNHGVIPINKFRPGIPSDVLKFLEEFFRINLSPFPHNRDYAHEIVDKIGAFLLNHGFDPDKGFSGSLKNPVQKWDKGSNYNLKAVLSSPAGKLRKEVKTLKIRKKKKTKVVLYVIVLTSFLFLIGFGFLWHLKKVRAKSPTNFFIQDLTVGTQNRIGRENFPFGKRVKRLILRNGTTEITLSSDGKIIDHRILFSRKKFIFILQKN